MKLLPRGLLVVCALAVAPLAAGAQAKGAPGTSRVSLQVGAQHTLDVPGLARVTVGDPAVADVRTASSRLTVKGMAPGRTTLTVWVGEARTTYEVVVR
ncbi:MAG: pilus assembly protein N-terminal domain-containing protein [Myxococcaceae bacterium]|nr:pilus assembly protein N-terminal domain-containing protein [Myxococcaceae bacterium]